MSSSPLTIEELLSHKDFEHLIHPEDISHITKKLIEYSKPSDDPIYIKVLSGIGAWVASLFIAIFLGVTGIFESAYGIIPCGLVLLLPGIFISRASNVIFLKQLSLAMVFAGNAALTVGIAILFKSNELLAILCAHLFICPIVYYFYDNYVYRYLSPLFAVLLVVILMMNESTFAALHYLIAIELILAGILLLKKKKSTFLNPLTYSVATMLPATLLFFNHLASVNWYRDFKEPLWPSSILLTGGLIYLYFHISNGSINRNKRLMILAVSSTILLGIFTTPGILVAIALLILGFAFGDKILLTYAYLFMPYFLVLFYYSLNTNLAHKSWILVGSGILLLGVRQTITLCQRKAVNT
ncbi:MAG: hypothetical protein COA79_17275 [Planctomycetota bacterium]|nr:MAG: hypothetical protein COA79_17275 [Planctomycetota bacterium]